MTAPEHDEDFEVFLKRRTLVANTPVADNNLEPPAALDEAVLKQAREAIKARQQPQRAPRWAVPVALAATILLCLSVVMNVSLNTNRPTAAQLQRMAADQVSSNEAVRADSPASSRGESERRRTVSGDIPSREVILPEAKIAGGPGQHPPVVAESSQDSSTVTSASGADAARQHASSTDGTSGNEQLASNAKANAPGRSVSKAEVDASGQLASNTAAQSSGQSATSSPAFAGAAASPSPPMSAPSAEPPTPAAPESTQSDKAAALDARAGTQDQTAVAKRKADALGVIPHPHDPKAWLQQIDRLRAEGKTAQATHEMRRFRAAFPTYAMKPAPPASSGAPK